MSIFHFLLVTKQNMNKWCRFFHKTTKRGLLTCTFVDVTEEKRVQIISGRLLLLHCLYSRAPLNMYATFVLDLNWEFEEKKKKKKHGEYMLQVRNLDLPSSHHYQDRSDTIDLLEGWCEGVVYLKSPGRPNDISSQLGKPCYPWSR